MELNRRDFLSASALVGGMAVAGASATVALADEAGEATAATTTLPVGTTQEDFDNSIVIIEPITEFVDEKTYDVVVIGAGTAGVPAVCAALEEGATVGLPAEGGRCHGKWQRLLGCHPRREQRDAASYSTSRHGVSLAAIA